MSSRLASNLRKAGVIRGKQWRVQIPGFEGIATAELLDILRDALQCLDRADEALRHLESGLSRYANQMRAGPVPETLERHVDTFLQAVKATEIRLEIANYHHDGPTATRSLPSAAGRGRKLKY